MNLIIDRTSEDVAYAAELRQLIMSREADPEQWAEWLSELRGRYSFHTFNRVGVEILETARIISDMYRHISVFPRTDWRVEDIPTPQQLSNYLRDIDTIRQVAAEAFDDVPPLPENMNNLTHTAANNIEIILMMAREFVIQASLIFVQSNMVESGFEGPYMITGGFSNA